MIVLFYQGAGKLPAAVIRGRGSLPRGPEGPESRLDVRARGPVEPEGELRVPRASAREVSLPAYIHMFSFIRAKMAIFRRQFGGLYDGGNSQKSVSSTIDDTIVLSQNSKLIRQKISV